MTHSAFEASLREHLKALCLHKKLVGNDDKVFAQRWTPSPYVDGRANLATEIYAFRPLRDGNRLIEIVEAVVRSNDHAHRASR